VRRAEGDKRRAFIAEAAALEDQTAKDAKARDSLLIHQLWFN
jgi:hypothetical protein